MRGLRVTLEEVWKAGNHHASHSAKPMQPRFIKLWNADPMQASSPQAQALIRVSKLIGILRDYGVEISSCQTFEELHVLNTCKRFLTRMAKRVFAIELRKWFNERFVGKILVNVELQCESRRPRTVESKSAASKAASTDTSG